MPGDTVRAAATDAADGCSVAIDANPGRPRAALLKAVKDLFDLPADRVRLTEGATHDRKRVHLLGIPTAEAVRHLAATLTEAEP